MLTLFPIRRYRVLRVVDAGHSNSLSTCMVSLSFPQGNLVDVPGVGDTDVADGGVVRGGLKWNIRRSSVGVKYRRRRGRRMESASSDGGEGA
jgi:hypothetical protein